MVYVFQKSSYGGAKMTTPWEQKKIVMGLILGVFLYALIGALAFQYINPLYTSQGLDETYDTTFNDAFYFAVVTLSTVGYGDVVPYDDGTKLFTAGYVLVSLFLVGYALEVSDFLFSIDVEELEEGNEEETKRFMSRARKQLVINVLIVFLLMLVSTIFFVYVEDYSFVDSLYFTVTTLSTVGYGDLAPRTHEGRLFAIFWVTIGVFMLFRLIGSLMDVILESRKLRWRAQREERQHVIREHLSARVGIIAMRNVTDTEAIQHYTKRDLIEVLTKMEFIMYRLEQEGKVDLSDFRRLDTAFKDLTPESINAEFASPESERVFSSIIGNVVP
ncbi:Two-pore potassium channel 1 [Hondaea fermentalgiana]|uniref:Two-pore potassium channel 1 n=1 Tax=Hondaea fermentalgiana TaxID=2315210 RepID=A0A2R5G9N6_9STRA|nr:Two-pore potassium channel 1 [Hondaea fermentalgiana]|eukprot:GBG27747.1 Two-pore potassium channel 1 [Hondaea fermentalgiana]